MHLNTASDAACVDLICLVTAQMSYYCNSLIKYKNLTQKIKDTFKKNGFINVKKYFLLEKY